MAPIIDTEAVNTAIERQLAMWPMAKANYDRLSGCRRRSWTLGGLEGAVQYNPARIVSTGADTRPEKIKERVCFLCGSNRPAEQISHEICEGWEMLVNPFPIFPVHFTIASKEHIPQAQAPLDMVTVAEAVPSLCTFYNGAKAGASAPDHLHFQAVLKTELPLMRLVERLHPADQPGIKPSCRLGVELPFRFYSGVITPGTKGMETLATIIKTCGENGAGLPDPELVNTYFWTDTQTGLMRGVAIPRRAHRPACYYSDGEDRLTVSPGAVDMAGLIITPREEDFGKITPEDVAHIYREVAF